MSGPLARAHASLELATSRRANVERAGEGAWHDEARRTVQQRVLTPLDSETARARAAVEQLDEELEHALKRLGD